MKPTLRTWTMLLIGAILLVGWMIAMRVRQPSADIDDPLVEARQAVADSFGMEVALVPGGRGGLEIEKVLPGRPAEQAGIEVGDRVVAVGDLSVWHVHQLAQYVGQQMTRFGAVSIMFERDGTYWCEVFGPRGAIPSRDSLPR
jgi:hypothetical protein